MNKQNYLSQCIQCIFLLASGTLSPVLFAEELAIKQLPIINVKATEDDKTKKTAEKSNLGALGEKLVVDTPFTVTTYTEQAIQDSQAMTVSGILRNDPSIRETTNSGHINENVQIRGFSVGFEDYNLNGLYGMAPTGRISTDILDNVSVLKGPNALVAGMAPNGAVGGVIMAQTKRANQDLTRVSALYEDGGYYKSGFDMARRLGDNEEFGVRISGSYGQGEHIIKEMDDTDYTATIAADYKGDKLTLNFDSYVARDKRKGGSPAMIAFVPCTTNSVSTACTTPLKVLDAPNGDTNYFPHLWMQQKSQYAGLSGEYKFNPDFKLFSGVGYVEKEYSGHVFGTRLIVNNTNTGAASSQYYGVNQTEHNVSANTGVEAKFNTGAVNHTLGLRADYLTRKYWYMAAATSTSFATNFYEPTENGSMPSIPERIPYLDNKYISYTLTDQLSMLNDRLQIILGARYQDIDSSTYNTRNNVWVNYSADKISPSIGLVVKPFDLDLSFYASYVEGLSEGKTVNEITYPTAANKGETLAPFQTKQYELGVKHRLGNWFNTLALYQIEKPEVYLDTTSLFVKDDAETRSRGVELSTTGNITDDLRLLANLAYIDAKYVKSGTASIVGKTVYGVPDFTAGLTLDYQIPQIEGLSVNARGTYISEQYLDNTNGRELPNYTIVDLGAKFATKIGGVNTTLRANVDNLTNKNYWAGVFNNNYAVVGLGRTYKIGLSFDF